MYTLVKANIYKVMCLCVMYQLDLNYLTINSLLAYQRKKKDKDRDFNIEK